MSYPKFDIHRLIPLKYGVERQMRLRELADGIGPEFLSDATIDARINEEVETLCVRLMTRVYSERIGNVAVSCPTDWWQHFKQRWFPGWALKRWPVVLDVQRFDVRAMFPGFKPPDKFGPVEYLAVRDWSYDGIEDGPT